jgi:hypothetical protein
MFPQVRGLYAGKKISIHSFSHRLCTSSSILCTRYPQRCRTLGFVSQRPGANVASDTPSG